MFICQDVIVTKWIQSLLMIHYHKIRNNQECMVIRKQFSMFGFNARTITITSAHKQILQDKQICNT